MSEKGNTTVLEEKKVKNIAAKDKKQKQSVIYIGPTIPATAYKNTVFNNGIPKELADLEKNLPAVVNLIIPLEKIAEARMELEKENSALQICYKSVLDYIKKGE